MTNNDRHKILIIEDEALVARELKSRLTNMGYEVAGVAYGAEGIELARRTRPDLLLTDIHLKNGEDGIEVACAVLNEQDVPVVFLTAYSDEDTVARAKAVTPYGYIIKPVENRELQIVIEMALYKHETERELKQTRELLETALTCIGSALVFVDSAGVVTDLNEEAAALLQYPRDEGRGQPFHRLFGIDGASSLARKIELAQASADVTKLPPFVIQAGHGLRLVDGIVGPREDGAVLIVRELSDIRDRLEPVSPPVLASADPARLSPSESSLCQLLVAIDGNDDVMAQASRRLHQMLRATDLISPHGKQELSISMPYTSVEEGRRIAESVRAALREELPDHVIALGLSSTEPNEQQPLELFRRAAWALEMSRKSGGNRVITWSQDAEMPIQPTGRERQRSFNNMVLLWNIMNLVVNTDDRDVLARRVCEHIVNVYGFSSVAVLEVHRDAIQLVAGVKRDREAALSGITDLALGEQDLKDLRSLAAGNGTRSSAGNRYTLKVSKTVFAHFRTEATVDPMDLDFLQTLLSYAGSGLAAPERVVSAERSTSRELLYQSEGMQRVMESVALVAQTDATVLVVGESGTGKESVARAIHDSSPRAGQPFIIVDCGAVVGSLIESELFGHVKGAFTGADRASPGRLKEAHGGTVLLDEVGELPLDVQVKLLRFVQEQQIAAVGSNRYETVDTRIIAATNRDLEALVRQGAFREDLYYRLNVFLIETPPLRDRRGDLEMLANHFLREFSSQYGKKLVGFSADAEQALLQHQWPGNIRQLMNVINRAVILCRDDRVSSIHLGLFPTSEAGATLSADAPEKTDLVDDWCSACVDSALHMPALPPLAQWLEEELIAAVLEQNDQVLMRAAAALGVPESTLRRKVARMRESGGDGDRRDSAPTVLPVLDELMRQAEAAGESALDFLSRMLLRHIEGRALSKADAAALMGVSRPTYRKLLQDSP